VAANGEPKGGDIYLLGNDRPMPAYKELIIRCENIAIENLEWRFQQRGPAALQDHLPLLGEAGRQIPAGWAARQIKIDKAVSPRWKRCSHSAKRSYTFKKFSPGHDGQGFKTMHNKGFHFTE
jgi:hypothetical protein